MNLAMEARDLYNENEKTLIKKPYNIHQRNHMHTYIYKTHTDIYTFIQNDMHKHKYIHTNAHI